jgi:SEL1 protein
VLHEIESSLDSPTQHAVRRLESVAEAADEDEDVAGAAFALLGDIFRVGGGSIEVNATAALTYYRKSASFGNTSSQYTLAVVFDAGMLGAERNPGLSVLYDYFSALGGSPSGMMALGHRHARGLGAPLRCASAVSYYRSAAKIVVSAWQGNPLVERRPQYLFEGPADPNKQIDETVVQYYQSEAAVQSERSGGQGDGKLEAALGRLHYHGTTHLRQDFEKAAGFFKAAIEAGEVSALSGMGYLYMRGLGVDKNYSMALGYFKRGSEKGDASAFNGLGLMYLKGHGIAPDKSTARRHFQKAVNNDHADACYNLGTIQRSEKDFQQSFYHFERAMRQGHVRAMYELGMMHLQGESTVSSCSSALELFKMAASRGDAAEGLTWRALFNFNRAHFPTAIFQFHKAARTGYHPAQMNAAWMYQHEWGVGTLLPPNSSNSSTTVHSMGSWLELAGLHFGLRGDHSVRHQADRWAQHMYRAAVASQHHQQSYLRGESFAHVKLGDYYFAGLVADTDAADAHHPQSTPDYKRAARQYRRSSSARARFNLGWMHEHGLGVPKDLKEAARLYESALEPEKGAWLPAHLALLRLRLKQCWESDAARSWRNGVIGQAISGVAQELMVITSPLLLSVRSTVDSAPRAAVGLGCLSTAHDSAAIQALLPNQSILVACPTGCLQLYRSYAEGTALFGSGPYTHDSFVCAAALHASGTDGGTHQLVHRGMGHDFVGGERNSLRAGDWEAPYTAFSVSFLHEGTEGSWGTATALQHVIKLGTEASPQSVQEVECHDTVAELLQKIESENGASLNEASFKEEPVSLLVRCPQHCTQHNGNSIWGRGIYMLESSVAVAARHATGVDGGLFNLTVLGAQASFEAKQLQGVASLAYGPALRSFRIEPVLPAALQAVGGREFGRWIGGEYTVEAWIKFERDQAGGTFQPMVVVCKMWSLCIRILQTGGGIRAQSMYYPDTVGVISRTALRHGHWHHIAVTKTENEHTIYVDGRLDNKRSTQGVPVFKSSAVLSIGSTGPPMHAQQLRGALGNVRIWSKALTEADLGRYAPFAIGGALNKELWASFNFEPDNGQYLDSSGNSHHLQVPRGALPVMAAALQPWERPAVRVGRGGEGGG